MKTGVLLLNVGTPKELSLSSVRQYLREFLGDPHVIQAPVWIRKPLVNGWIVPLRAKNSLAKYQKVWRKEGSPLTLESQKLNKQLQQNLGVNYEVHTGFRYGDLPIREVAERFVNCDKVILVPLFPQEAQSSTITALGEARRQLRARQCIETSAFYEEPWFLDAWAELIRKSIQHKRPERLILSYHGLPISHINKQGCSDESCGHPSLGKGLCYRAQCLATSRGIQRRLDFSKAHVLSSFQSRLGPLKWIRPSTQELLQQLLGEGVRRVAMACPAFVVDGLETLEEAGMELRGEFLRGGGEEFTLVPCLNSEPQWVIGLAQWLKMQEGLADGPHA